MALVGYEREKERIGDKIREIQSHLEGGKSATAEAAVTSKANSGGAPRRVLSAAARKRIAAAQKKRWAEHRKNQAAGK
jgi:hypothetical protein